MPDDIFYVQQLAGSLIVGNAKLAAQVDALLERIKALEAEIAALKLPNEPVP